MTETSAVIIDRTLQDLADAARTLAINEIILIGGSGETTLQDYFEFKKTKKNSHKSNNVLDAYTVYDTVIRIKKR